MVAAIPRRRSKEAACACAAASVCLAVSTAVAVAVGALGAEGLSTIEAIVEAAPIPAAMIGMNGTMNGMALPP